MAFRVMNVQWRFGGQHPQTNEFLGCVTTDSPEEFKLWMAMHCPNAKITISYQRSQGALFAEGGYDWRLNYRILDRDEQLLFKLTWCS